MESNIVKDFSPSELSPMYMRDFIFKNKFYDALYMNKEVFDDFNNDLNFADNFVNDSKSVIDMVSVYFWLLSKNISLNNSTITDCRDSITSWRDERLNSKYEPDLPNEGFTAFEAFDDSNELCFDFSKKKLRSESEIKLTLDIFGQHLIPEFINELLMDNSDLEYFEFNRSLFDKLVDSDLSIDDLAYDCEVFSEYIPSTITEKQIEVINDCMNLLYESCWMDIGCIFLSSSRLSNYLRRATVAELSEILESFKELFDSYDPGLMSMSYPRVITKESPLWELCFNNDSDADNISHAIVFSYFMLDIASPFCLKYFSWDEHESFIRNNSKINNLIESKEWC